MSLSLRARWMIWFTMVMAVALGVFAVLVYSSLSHELQANLDASLNQVVSSLDLIIREQAQKPEGKTRTPAQPKRRGEPDDLKEQLAFLQKDSLRKDSAVKPAIRPLDESGTSRSSGTEELEPVWGAIYEHIVLNPRNFKIQIMDTTGAIVYRSQNLGGDSLDLPEPFIALAQDTAAHFTTIRQAFHSSQDPQPIRVAVARSRAAVIAAAYPVDEVQGTLDDFFLTLVYLFPGVLLVSLLGGWLLARASLRPVDEITRTAKDITASHLSRRLPVPNADVRPG